jgi:hypothetical protein
VSLIESAPSRGSSSLAVAVRFSRHSGSGASLSRKVRRCVPRAPPASQPTLGPPGQPEKAIGHESLIEPWWAPDHPFCFAGFRTDRLRREQPMKTAGRGNPNHWGYSAQHPSPWPGQSEQISLDHLGWEARKTPAAGYVFFLDFPLYRTFRDLASLDNPYRIGRSLCILGNPRSNNGVLI